MTKKPEKGDFFEKHPSKLQFLTNIGLIVFTLLTIIVSSYYSRKNLELSTNQYKSAIDQFKYLRTSDSLKALSDLKKDRRNIQRSTQDSIHAAKIEVTQYLRNKHQDTLNSQQLAINKQQLTAIKTQAITAQNQFSQQEEQYRQQLYEKRPIFTIDSIKIDSTVSYKPKISFVFTNRGSRVAHVDSTVLAFYNPDPKYFCSSVTKNSSNLDLIPQQTFLTTSWINIFKDCLHANSTQYYLLIYYKDKITGESQIEPIFFTYVITKQRQFSYGKIYGLAKKEFIKQLKKKMIFVAD
jgi:hypothetical protein